MSDTVAAQQLRAFFERWQRLEEEKKTLSDDLKELFAEAKGVGYDTKAMRAVFRDMMADSVEREEAEAIYDLYWGALNGRAHPAPAPARAHVEIIEEFPPSADHVSPPARNRKSGSESANTENDHVDRSAARAAPDKGNATGGVGSQVSFDKTIDRNASLAAREGEEAAALIPEPDFEPLTFLTRQDKPLRPHCLSPENCGGYGKIHCYRCTVAAAGSEAA